jgi:hypothetical protein
MTEILPTHTWRTTHQLPLPFGPLVKFCEFYICDYSQCSWSGPGESGLRWHLRDGHKEGLLLWTRTAAQEDWKDVVMGNLIEQHWLRCTQCLRRFLYSYDRDTRKCSHCGVTVGPAGSADVTGLTLVATEREQHVSEGSLVVQEHKM